MERKKEKTRHKKVKFEPNMFWRVTDEMSLERQSELLRFPKAEDSIVRIIRFRTPFFTYGRSGMQPIWIFAV
jgi:hypothetical protein